MAGEVTIFSTTNSQSEIDAAVDYDLETNHGETPPPSRNTVTVVSKSDDPHDVETGARLYDKTSDMFISSDTRPGGQGVAVGWPSGPAPRQAGVDVRSTTDDPQHVEEQRKEATGERESCRLDYLTRQPKRKFSDLVNQVSQTC
jgi:hypothetical protein